MTHAAAGSSTMDFDIEGASSSMTHAAVETSPGNVLDLLEDAPFRMPPIYKNISNAININGYEVLKAALQLSSAQKMLIYRAKYDESGLPDGFGNHDPNRQMTRDHARRSNWHTAILDDLQRELRDAVDDNMAIYRLHAIRSLATPFYDENIHAFQPGDQKLHRDEPLDNTDRFPGHEDRL